MPHHFALNLIHLLQMDFGTKSIKSEKEETTFQMDTVQMDFEGICIRTESIYRKKVRKEASPMCSCMS